MLFFIARKLAWAAATMLAVSVLVYLALEVNIDDVAVKVLGQFSTVEQRNAWLLANGYREPFVVRYVHWLLAFISGDWGMSTYFRTPVIELIPARLMASFLLALGALLVMVPTSLLLGVLAGMRTGSATDRVVSVFSIVSTSIPDFASAVLLSAIFVFWLGCLPGTSTMLSGVTLREMVLPVAVLALYSTGYIARITRTAMAEAMASHFVRTARLKGATPFRIVVRHALRNALIVPATVVMMQVPWLLSGVIVVEVFFAYKGFGTLLYDAALNSDVYLIEACAMVSVFVVVLSQILSDIAYAWLNPRISFFAAKPIVGAAHE